MKLRIFLLVLVCSFQSAFAADTTNPYQVEVPIASHSPADWQKTVPVALEKVLAQVSGDAKVAQSEEIRKAMAKPDNYVQSYNYSTVDASGAQKAMTLQVRFSPKAINTLLGRSDPAVQDATQTVALDESGRIILKVSGVNGLKEYAALVAYLRSLKPVVTEVKTTEMGKDTILSLKITTDMAELQRLISQSHNLIAQNALEPAAQNAPVVLAYQWNPNGGAQPGSLQNLMPGGAQASALPSSSAKAEDPVIPPVIDESDSGAQTFPVDPAQPEFVPDSKLADSKSQ